MSATLCADCGRVVYTRDVDEHNLCCFCAPSPGAAADAGTDAPAGTPTTPPAASLTDEEAEAREQFA